MCRNITANVSAMRSGGLELLTLNLEQMTVESTEHQESTKLPLLIASVGKRYKIQGTSFTTNGKKWFEFSEDEWKKFQHRQWTHYPAWSFDRSTITEV